MLERPTQGTEEGRDLLPVTSGLRVDTSPSLGVPELSAIATRVFEQGDRVFVVSGPILRVPTIYSFQLDADHHIDPQERDGRIGIGHYVNHSCEPSTGWGGVVLDGGRIGIQFVALRRINPGEEVNFDYATTEADTAARNPCRCGSEVCRGTIHGYRGLSQERRDTYSSRGVIASYLLDQEGISNP